MRAILFDLDGVLYEGDTALAGAADTIDWFNKKSIPHLFLTNTSSRPRSALVAKLAGFGIETTADHFLTPPVASVSWLKQNDINTIALFIPDATREEFSDFNIIEGGSDEKIDAIIVGDMGPQWDFHTLNRAFRILINDSSVKLVALGMTRYWRADDGLRLDAGPYVAALQYAASRDPIVMGKPARDFYQSALDILGVDANNTVMIGDDIKGDIEAAQSAGLKSILVKTGKFTNADLELEISPDVILDSIADLADWWLQNSS